MIWGILGDTGEGKTLYMSYMGYQSLCANSEVISNFPLNYTHTLVKSIDDLKGITLGENKILLLDELWLSGDSYNSGNVFVQKLARILLQCRKLDTDCIHSNQTQMQLFKRIRENSSMYLTPRVTMSYNELTNNFTFEKPHPKKNIVPFTMSVKFFDKWLRYLNYDEPFLVYPAHLFYNTREFMQPLKTVNYKKLSEKYENFVGSVQMLSDCLQRIDGLTKPDAQGFSRFLIALKKNENLKLIAEKEGKL